MITWGGRDLYESKITQLMVKSSGAEGTYIPSRESRMDYNSTGGVNLPFECYEKNMDVDMNPVRMRIVEDIRG